MSGFRRVMLQLGRHVHHARCTLETLAGGVAPGALLR